MYIAQITLERIGLTKYNIKTSYNTFLNDFKIKTDSYKQLIIPMVRVLFISALLEN